MCALQGQSKSHAVDHLSRLCVAQLIPVNVDPTFFDLHEIRLDCAIMQMLQEREQTAFKLDV